MEFQQLSLRSKDGTIIAYEKAGSGQPIILVSPALADRTGNAGLASVLTRNLTVINYDRRGRGASTDTLPFAVQREVEDIEALIESAGGTAYLFGSSSGAALALEAASELPGKVRALFMYEPPFIVDGSHAPLPSDYAAHLRSLIADNRRSEAVDYFMLQAVGIPEGLLRQMHGDPMWPSLERAAHTLPYDGELMASMMTGKPLPAHRWDPVKCPALVMVGGASPDWLHSAAHAISQALPKAKYRELEGRDHSAVTSAPRDVATTMYGFFLSERI